MSRAAAYELTNAEKRDLIKLIEQGKPLPEKYRFILFDDKREGDRRWARWHLAVLKAAKAAKPA